MAAGQPLKIGKSEVMTLMTNDDKSWQIDMIWYAYNILYIYIYMHAYLIVSLCLMMTMDIGYGYWSQWFQRWFTPTLLGFGSTPKLLFQSRHSRHAKRESLALQPTVVQDEILGREVRQHCQWYWLSRSCTCCMNMFSLPSSFQVKADFRLGGSLLLCRLG